MSPTRCPSPALSVKPCCAVPEIVGGEVLEGATSPLTTALCADSACAEPAPFEAVTCTRRVKPTSEAVNKCVDVVAPAMLEQFAPEESQRRHW